MNKRIGVTVSLIIIILLAGALLFGRSDTTKQELEDLVFSRIEEKTGGVWDRKLEISETNEDGGAVKGKWFAREAWDWIAWKKDEDTWQVLISMDGFHCDELAQLPKKYEGFFYDVVHAPSGEKYCY
jgi:hypothetical protein